MNESSLLQPFWLISKSSFGGSKIKSITLKGEWNIIGSIGFVPSNLWVKGRRFYQIILILLGSNKILICGTILG